MAGRGRHRREGTQTLREMKIGGFQADLYDAFDEGKQSAYCPYVLVALLCITAGVCPHITIIISSSSNSQQQPLHHHHQQQQLMVP